jgi:uncharacterized protein DUF5994
MARPVRLVLARELGTEIDGAWWPHTASVASELPELIGVLHAPLGEIIDICINWSPTEGPVDLESIVGSTRTIAKAGPRRPRLMLVKGRRTCVTLLVVPYMTSPNLGTMVMRGAAGLAASHADRDSQLWETARSVASIAKAESATWAASMRDEASVAGPVEV